MKGYSERLKDAISLVMDITDMEEREAYQSGKYGDLLNDETVITLKLNEEPYMSGPIKVATLVADALKFQYYEETESRLRA